MPTKHKIKNKRLKTKKDNLNIKDNIPQTSIKTFPINFEYLEYFRDAYCFFADTGDNVYHAYSLVSNF